MFDRVLVANRGEIALRVIQTLRRMNIKSIAVYSDADARAPYVRAADEAYRLGPPSPSLSYLHQDRVLYVAAASGADAIHPGYGFLSENAEFASRCQDAGLAWIGPQPEAMALVGDKVSARKLAKKVGVPVAPGSEGALRDAADAAAVARDIGYPVLLKASAGGGGIGMRVVASEKEMTPAFQACQETAASSFGSPDVFLEKYLQRPRHIELQILGDHDKNVVHLGERECSIQRRHQKLVEETPSPALDPRQREELGDLGVQLAQAAGYANAGTLEFLYEDGHFYFNEVNARLQVEHPVTELVYGVDLVEAQLRVAAGEPNPFSQDALQAKGHAIEVRVNAEDPLRDHRPTPGPVRVAEFASMKHVRVDSGVESGWHVPPEYDSLLAKVMAWGATRDEALDRLTRALDASTIQGTQTNLAFHRALVRDTVFRAGDLTTRFLEERPILETLKTQHAEGRIHAVAVAAALASAPRGGLGAIVHRLNTPPRIQLGGQVRRP